MKELFFHGDYSDIEVEIVYSPRWERERLSYFAMMELGI